MKSNFSHFLHHKPSHSDVNPQSATISSPSGLTRWSRSNQVANFFQVDIRVKPEYDNFCAGRSMVEMLGVLAIIGVLSVGAIAGYGKAMIKYKLNQHAAAVNMLINNILAIKDKLQHNESGITDYATLLNKLNLLPDGIIQVNDHYLRDKYFNNQIRVFYEFTPDYELNSTYFKIGKSESDHTLEICYNILKVVKENAANLYFVRTYKVYTDNSGHPSDNLYTFYGDGYCTGNRDCLRNLNINKLEQACQTCKEGICGIRIFYK